MTSASAGPSCYWPQDLGQGIGRSPEPENEDPRSPLDSTGFFAAFPSLYATYPQLRGKAVAMLAEAGCTNAEIAAITGHSLETVDRILERYLARTEALARNAIAKFENANRTILQNAAAK